MRYYFILISIVVAWVVGVMIAYFNISTGDRLLLYLALMILTIGMYLIGFTERRR